MNTKVLVVDDEFLIRMSLESGLSDLGHQVKTAETFSGGAGPGGVLAAGRGAAGQQAGGRVGPGAH